MKKTLFIAIMLIVFAGVSVSAKAEVYSINDSPDGGYEVGVEYFKLFKKIEKPPADINPKLTRSEVFDVFESSRRGEKYPHKGSNNGKTTLLSIIPHKAETSMEEYELSISENGKWESKLLQSKETANPQVFYVCMLLVFFGITCVSILERLWIRDIKRLLFFYLVTLIIGYLMLDSPKCPDIACLIPFVGLITAVAMLCKPIEKTLPLFTIGWTSYFAGGMIIFIIFSIEQKPDLSLLLSQWMTFIGASIFAALSIGEGVYQIKKKVDEANNTLVETPNENS